MHRSPPTFKFALSSKIRFPAGHQHYDSIEVEASVVQVNKSSEQAV